MSGYGRRYEQLGDEVYRRGHGAARRPRRLCRAGTAPATRYGTATAPDLVSLTFLSFEYVRIPVFKKGVSVLDALLGEVGEEAGSARLRGGQSVYATVRRYRRAAQNVETDRKFN